MEILWFARSSPLAIETEEGPPTKHDVQHSSLITLLERVVGVSIKSGSHNPLSLGSVRQVMRSEVTVFQKSLTLVLRWFVVSIIIFYINNRMVGSWRDLKLPQSTLLTTS